MKTCETKPDDLVVPSATEGGLLIDDFLHWVEVAAKYAAERQQPFDVNKLLHYPGAKRALEKLVRATVKRHHGNVYAAHNPLLKELGENIYGALFREREPRRFRITDPFINPVLQKVLELGLRAIVSLPPRDEKPYTLKQFRSLAASLSKLAKKVRLADKRGVRERIELLSQPASGHKPELVTLAGEMESAARALESAAKLKVGRIRLASPNPQVAFAMYMAGFIKACTGRQHYESLKALLEASFHAIGKTKIPKWVDRLEVEMALQRKSRAKWLRKITV